MSTFLCFALFEMLKPPKISLNQILLPQTFGHYCMCDFFMLWQYKPIFIQPRKLLWILMERTNNDKKKRQPLPFVSYIIVNGLVVPALVLTSVGFI